MDRCAVFVDAGYLYAEGGKLCCGTPQRRRLKLQVDEFSVWLGSFASSRCVLPILRTYWYDGARDGIATASQQEIAALPNVKLRLGRLNVRGEQKGVDALIYRDLMTLGRERAISEAYVLSGDEDLREGVRAAQDMGVRVTLIGVEASSQKFNQSLPLVQEADEVLQLGRPELSGFFEKVSVDAMATAPAGGAPAVTDAARAFTAEWWQGATDTERNTLAAQRPRIPKTLDVELLRSVEAATGGSLRGHDDLHRAARAGFWEAVAAMIDEGATPHD